MRFLACTVLLLSAAVLTSAAVGRNEDNEIVENRYRAFRKNANNGEGRTLASLFGSKGCGGGTGTTTTTITHTPTTTDGTSDFTFTVGPTSEAARDFADNDEDDLADDSNNDDDDFEIGAPIHEDDGDHHSSRLRPNTARQYDYELRRQEDANKQLRKQIQLLRVRNMQNIRRANRARRQQQRRNKNSRRQMLRRMRNNRRRNNSRRRNRRNGFGF